MKRELSTSTVPEKSDPTQSLSAIWYVDILRIIAAFFVIVNHTNSSIFLQGEPEVTTFLSLSWFFFSKCAVPVFFMISGILLLRRKESFAQVFRKRMGRPICALLLASLLWYLLDHGLSGFQWSELWEGILNCGHSAPLWFLYTYIGILCMLPMLQCVSFHADQKLLRGIVVGWLLYGCVYFYMTNALELPRITGYLQLPFFSGYVGYLVLGYYLHTYLSLDKKWTIFLGGTCFIIGWSWAVGYTWHHFRSSGAWTLVLDELMYPPCLLISVGMFLIVKGLCTSWRPRRNVAQWLVGLRELMFDVYLLHPFVIRYTYHWNSFLCTKMPKLVAMLLWEIAVFVVSAGISHGVSYMIKTVKKILQKTIKNRETVIKR